MKHLCKLRSQGGGVLNKVKYGEALPCGPTPRPLIHHFGTKGTPLIYLLWKKGTPFTYLLWEVLFSFSYSA